MKNDKTMDHTSPSTPASAPLPIFPTRVELKVADFPPKLPKKDSLADLADVIAKTAIIEIQKFVTLGNPLDDPEQSSWLWLRADGSIDVVYDNDRENRRLKGEAKGSLFLEAFKCQQDSTPNSKFHRWILNEEGAFIGDIRTKLSVTNPLWDRSSGNMSETSKYFQSVIKILELQRFSLEPLTAEEIKDVLAEEAYLRAMRERVLSWITRGDYTYTADRLSAKGLIEAIRAHGNRFIYSVGRKKVYASLVTRMKELLANKISGASV